MLIENNHRNALGISSFLHKMDCPCPYPSLSKHPGPPKQGIIYMSVTSKLCLLRGFITEKLNAYYYYLLDFVTWQEGKSDYAADELS